MRNVRWSWQTNHVDNVLILKIQMKCCLCFCFARVLISGIRAVQSVWSQISFNAGWPLIRYPLLFKLNCYILFIPNENFSNELSTFIICVTQSLFELVTYQPVSLFPFHCIVPLPIPSPGLYCIQLTLSKVSSVKTREFSLIAGGRARARNAGRRLKAWCLINYPGLFTPGLSHVTLAQVVINFNPNQDWAEPHSPGKYWAN